MIYCLEKQVDLYKKSYELNGTSFHLKLMIQECAELQQAICKSLIGRESNMLEELADVQIMLNQLKFDFEQSGCFGEFLKHYNVKLKRLETRLGYRERMMEVQKI